MATKKTPSSKSKSTKKAPTPAKKKASAPAKKAPAPAKKKAPAPAPAPAPAKKKASAPVKKASAPALAPAPAKKKASAPVEKASVKKVPASAPAPAKTKASVKKASVKKVPAKSGVKKPTPGASTTSVAKKKKTDRRVAPTVVSSRKTVKKTGPVGKKTPRRKINFANPRSVAAAAAGAETDSEGYVVINGRRVRSISTKGIVVKKKTRLKAVPETVKTAEVTDMAKIKTHLTKRELTAYKSLLLVKRRHIVGMVSGLETEALRSSSGNLSSMPIHMADIGTDAFEQDFTLGMAATERELIFEIDSALDRIATRIYGVCQSTGEPIPKARLQAKPWAKYTIEAARIAERNRTTD